MNTEKEVLKELEKVLNVVEKLSLLNQIEYFEVFKKLLKSHDINYSTLPNNITLDELMVYTACSILALRTILIE